MTTDVEKPKQNVPTPSSLIARIRVKLETGGQEISIGNNIILQTSEHIYGFFELVDSKHPYMAIKSPIDGNPYDISDQTVIVAPVGDIAKDFILETSRPGLLDVNAILDLESMDKEKIVLKDACCPTHYEISSAGEVSAHSDPTADVPIEEIPESD